MSKEQSAERIVILDFVSGKVFIRKVPMNMIESDSEDIVNYFEPILGIHADDCHYMVVNDDDFIDQK